eukprot:Trichotokara_eunicae@DN1941_c0_g1_i2.p1
MTQRHFWKMRKFWLQQTKTQKTNGLLRRLKTNLNEEAARLEDLDDHVQHDIFPPVDLKDWLAAVEEIYGNGVILVRVTSKGLKVPRKIKVSTSHLMIGDSVGVRPWREISLCSIETVALGFSSDAFRKLIDLTPVNSAIPLPSQCAVIRLQGIELSLVFPNEIARNELILLLRVKRREARRQARLSF